MDAFCANDAASSWANPGTPVLVIPVDNRSSAASFPIALLDKANNRIWVLDYPYSWSKGMLGRQRNTEYYRSQVSKSGPDAPRKPRATAHSQPALDAAGIPGLLIAAG